MITAPDLPVELHAEILRCLHHYRDRPTLLATALVCKDWCIFSQRILFSVVTDHWYNIKGRESVMSTHMRFLRIISEYPHRLGPLVYSYGQNALACNPAGMPIPESARSGFDLWQLMEQALPAMVNLKHLYFSPLADASPPPDNWASLNRLLSSFTFQLETLTWRSYFHPQNGFPEFLASQRRLTHLEIGQEHDRLEPSWLSDGVCPHLISMARDVDSLTHVARTRSIVALKWYPTQTAAQGRRNTLILDRLEYLSVYNYQRFRHDVGPIDLNVKLLELTEGPGGQDTVASLTNFPNLQVLALIPGIFMTASNDVIDQRAVDYFNRLPSLEYIIWRYSNSRGREYRYVKLSPSPSPTEGVLHEELDIHYDLAAPWWTIYNV